MQKTVLIVGTFDTKGDEFAFLRKCLIEAGLETLSLDAGVMDKAHNMPVDFSAQQIAAAANREIDELRASGDRGDAMKVMSKGAAVIARRLYDQGRFDAVIGMGGSGGTAVVTSAMRALPIGIPKICVSTVASTDTSPYVGTKDVVLIPSITDVAGLNRISRQMIAHAAGAISGMLLNAPKLDPSSDRPVIVASMFGNTTKCVDACREQLSQKGYEVLVFHATGSGGRTMETVIEDGIAIACLDITTTELADHVCGGIFSAGEDRLLAAGKAAIPHLIVPGCVDMVNFGPLETVPKRYRDAGRNLYEWNPSVTLMRTNADENRQIGEMIAKRANEAKGPVACLFPLRGVSILDGDGERFCDRAVDSVLLENHTRTPEPKCFAC